VISDTAQVIVGAKFEEIPLKCNGDIVFTTMGWMDGHHKNLMPPAQTLTRAKA